MSTSGPISMSLRNGVLYAVQRIDHTAGSGEIFTYGNAAERAAGFNLGTGRAFSLASIHSDQIDSMLTEKLQWVGATAAFIGLTRGTGDDPTTGWRWDDGTEFDYGHWAFGEPNNTGNREYYVEKYAYGAWNDIPSNDSDDAAIYSLQMSDLRHTGSLILHGSAFDDVLVGSGARWSTLRGGEGDDRLTVYKTKGYLAGDAGNDTLILTTPVAGSQAGSKAFGMAGNDTIYGSGGCRLSGGAGQDVLHLANGDSARGDSGVDEFHFNIGTAGASATITDYTNGEALVLELGAGQEAEDFHFLGRTGFSGTAGDVIYAYGDGQTRLSVDLDGDKLADVTLTLQGRHYLAAEWVSIVAGALE